MTPPTNGEKYPPTNGEKPHVEATQSAVPDHKFQDLIVLLSDTYVRDVSTTKKEYDRQLNERNKEIKVLRAQLEQAGLSPDYENENMIQRFSSTSSFDPRRKSSVFDGVREFEIKATWEEQMEGGNWDSSLDAYLSRCGNSGDKAVESEGNQGDAKKLRKFVILPNSVFRMNWDFAGLFLICYDLITIPFNQAFQPDPGWFSVSMDWITLLFWSSDMLQGFFLAYFDKGQLVTSNCRILKHYLTTWFLADLIVVGPEWLMTGVSPTGEAGAAGAGKILKTARAVRVLRLLRLVKIQRMLNLLYDLIESEYTFILINLTKLLVSVLVLNHVVACGWYFTGTTAMDNDMHSWIVESGVKDKDSIPYAYSTSLHWSLTQFTPASMDVSAKNILERVFSIVILFFAMVVFSSIVGSISGSMTTLRSMKSDQMKQFWLLRRYLRQRDVSKDLSSRIHKYLEHHCNKQNNHVQPYQIKVLDGLSESLQNELTHQMHSPHLLDHPFFNYLNEEMEVVMHRLCRLALKQQSYAEREFVFGAGDEAQKVFFVKNGSLEYTTMDRSPLRPPPQAREWISEALLWTSWRHQGDLLAVIESELISLDPGMFVQVMSVHPRPWFYARHYAGRFIRFLNHLGKARVSDIIRHTHFYHRAVDGIESSTSGNLGGQEALLISSKSDGLREAGKTEDSDKDEYGEVAGLGQPPQLVLDEQMEMTEQEEAVYAASSSNEVLPDDVPMEDLVQERTPPPKLPSSQVFPRRVFGFCPCPASFSSVVPGPNVAMTWR